MNSNKNTMNPKRDFKGVWVPKEIYLSKKLSWTEKILLLEIDSLDNDQKGCYASNQYLANHLGIKPNSLANMISKLKSLGYIEQLWFDGRNRGLRVNLKDVQPSSVNESRVHKKVKPPSQKGETEPSQKSEHSNTSKESLSNTQSKTPARVPFSDRTTGIPVQTFSDLPETPEDVFTRCCFEVLADKRMDSPFDNPKWEETIAYAAKHAGGDAELFRGCIDYIAGWAKGRITPEMVANHFGKYLQETGGTPSAGKIGCEVCENHPNRSRVSIKSGGYIREGDDLRRCVCNPAKPPVSTVMEVSHGKIH